jgi:DNA-3-methyladenine glycosylase II
VPAAAKLDQAVAHLRESDPVLRALIDEIGPENLGAWPQPDGSRAADPASPDAGQAAKREGPRDHHARDHYAFLVRAITGQQLSTKAARAIHERLIARYGGRAPTPDEVLAEDPEELRAAAGLSRAKVVYLRSLAEHVLDRSLELHKLGRLPDDQVIAELVAVKGLGEWSAHMFLMFNLQRPDVLAVGDLGIRRAVMLRYGLEALPTPAQLEAIAEPWRPYRTLACLFLWRSLEATPV